ncbi:hypothetical protein [Nocardia sp. NPDC057030]|uniref:hypothetical protein n=1 Tax=unclassified Nocardia TaxID=2637762 RepID=UPI003633E29A
MVEEFLIAYAVCMVIFIVHIGEAARENKDDDPIVAMLPHSPALCFTTIVFTFAASVLWPWFALSAVMRWLSPRVGALAARVHAKAAELDAAERQDGS